MSITRNLRDLSRLLVNVEDDLKVGEIYLTLQPDGSGAVRLGHTDADVFLFHSTRELAAWITAPRVVKYDDAGDVVKV